MRKELIPFFVITEIVLIIGCALVGYYAETVSVLQALKIPLIIICVVVGIVAFVFIAIRVFNETRGKRNNAQRKGSDEGGEA